jgi:hypothetical protein
MNAVGDGPTRGEGPRSRAFSGLLDLIQKEIELLTDGRQSEASVADPNEREPPFSPPLLGGVSAAVTLHIDLS